MLLSQFLFWLMGAGGGVAAYFLIEHVGFLAELGPQHKRWAAAALSAAIPLAAWGAGIGMGYLPLPETWQVAFEEGFALIGAAFGLSQLIHSKDMR